MSLLKRFLELEKDSESCYYRLTKSKPISDPKESMDFIKEYFGLGRKEDILSENEMEGFKKSGKHRHTVSLYFLGVLLKDVFNKKIEDYLKQTINFGCNNYYYTYTWFVCCLFHDMAWNLEKEKLKVVGGENFEDLFDNIFIEKFKIENHFYKHIYINGKKIVFQYSFDLFKKYLYYRYDHKREIEHGIVAGILLYDRLIKNYNNKWRQCKNSMVDSCYTEEYFSYNDRVWRKEHKDHFAYIADCISSHNIWNSEDKELYLKYGLKDLIIENDNLIEFDKNPLLFMLAILDTIEPVKFFEKYSSDDVWRNIDISYNANSIKIKIDSLFFINYTKWFDKIRTLKDWIKIDIIVKKNVLELIL